MNDFLDSAGNIRPGETLNAESLDRYLKSRIDTLSGTPEIRQFPGGASNLTYHIHYPDKDLVLRRPPFGHKAASAHDMHREYRVLNALRGHYPVPSVLDYCDDEDVLGAPFYVMEQLRGIILRREPPKGLSLSEEQARQLSLQMVELLSKLHSLDYDACGLSDLGKPQGYAKRQIDGWIRRYREAATDDAPDTSDITTWLEDHLPSEQASGLIHNDFRFDNVVLDPKTLEPLGVLDWEMATLGDPIMDLGNTLIYWIQQDDPPMWHLNRMQPTHLPGMLTRQEFADLYAKQRNISLPALDYYMAYGYFRLGVILQQLYARWKSGHSKDQRYGLMLPVINLCMDQARSLIERT